MPKDLVYHTYSDISGFFDPKTNTLSHLAYAFIITLNTKAGDRKTIVSKSHGIIPKNSVFTCPEAEIFAVALALREIPKGSTVIVHSDIKGINDIVNKRKESVKLKYSTQKFLSRVKRGLICQFLYEKRGYRDSLYMDCHSTAKSFAQSFKPIESF